MQTPATDVPKAQKPVLLIPGHDDATLNTNSCLYKTFGAAACISYNPGDLAQFPETCPDTAIVHSFGYFAFLVARAAGRLRDVTRLIVIDGWFPHDKQWGSVTCAVDVPAGVACTFFFPTFGDRSEYALEAVVRQAMVTRRDITVVRGICVAEMDENRVQVDLSFDSSTKTIEVVPHQGWSAARVREELCAILLGESALL